MPVLDGSLVRIARLRAGLTQRDLATRLDLPQSSVARWESGARQPSGDSLRAAVAACGLDIVVGLRAMDRSNDSLIWELLDLDPAERLGRQVAAANGTGALRAAGRDSVPDEFSPLVLLNSLAKSEVSYVLIGRLAENIRGSPAMPVESEVVICAAGEIENRVALEAALRTLRASRSAAPLDPPVDRRPLPGAERWDVPELGTTLAIEPRPPGTYGYSDLVRGASDERLVAGGPTQVAGLLDLIRIADSSVDLADRLGLPLLTRAHELTTDYVPAGERSMHVPEGLEELFALHGVPA
jgi:transcriptional regulator with XRE-family HTH domain